MVTPAAEMQLIMGVVQKYVFTKQSAATHENIVVTIYTTIIIINIIITELS